MAEPVHRDRDLRLPCGAEPVGSPAMFELAIPPGDFAGYIFDCDGTLIDSMPMHYRAWNTALCRHGLRGPLDEELFYSLGGVPTRRVAEILSTHHGLKADPEVLFHQKEALFVELLAQVESIDPVVAFARSAAQTHPVAVASGGPRRVVQRSLELAGLAALFPIVVTADDVVHGKPAPDMFLLAAERMGVAPTLCLVFEDAEPGHRAAAAAGMHSVHVPSRGLR